jgi:uncharacterized membrane protein (UPF0127 family)
VKPLLLLALVAACQDGTRPAGDPELPPSDKEAVVFPPGARADEVEKAVEEGLRTPGHGARGVYFIVLRDGERHGTGFRPEGFHAVIGAGRTMPEGALVVRRVWAMSGQVDGNNEQPETYGISVAVEPGAATPYSDPIRAAAAAFAEALSRRVPLHPDCVLAMEEIPYTNGHASDAAERELAKAARERVPVPPPQATVVIRSGTGEIPLEVERRNTAEGIQVGMMFRTRFDGDARGMLFEYPNRDYRRYWMKNCRIPIDVAYIGGGKIEEIHTMEPAFGLDTRNPRYYESDATADLVLEVPGGWFRAHGVNPGDRIEVRPLPAKAGD